MSHAATIDLLLQAADDADERADRLRTLCGEVDSRQRGAGAGVTRQRVARAMREAIRETRADLEAVDDLTEG
jgi:ribonuclease P protein component